ncbi:acyl-CoA dehydrogenase [Hyphomicrobiales bacterium BP6-180914]|uniref:Acyl-CoA dehydrogenase n=1 Tax=Lichenifustis flavocetrariae TaxID=2949735 RepID=A0AA42CNJ0_9HYPH|nr:acyl-CoA dehydrogenase [Lichenifustis flavocetrariae]
MSQVAEDADASASVAAEAWRVLFRSGLAMAPFQIELGGEDLVAPRMHQDLVAVLRLVGGADLSIARLYEGHVNAIALVRRYGTATQLERLARDVADGSLAGVWGADDATGLWAEDIGGSWQLKGRKILASGAGFVTRPLVTARTDAGQVMLLPRLEAGERADVSGWTAQGMRSTATGSVDFSGMVLDAEQVLGSPGDFMRQPHFSGGAWRFCAVHLGAAERLVDLLREHLVSRGRDGDPYQQQRIAQCVAATTTASFWIADAARRLSDETADPIATVAFVNLTRMVTERAALDVLEAVHRGIGLAAFVRPHPVERIARDLSTYLRQPVPDLAMADAARAILASPRATASLWSTDEG